MPRGRPRKSNDALVKSAEMIGWALGGLEREITQTRDRLTALTAHASRLRQQLGKQATRTTAAPTTDAAPAARAPRRSPRRAREMSAEARKRMSEMLKKRWADRKKKGLKRL